MHNHTAVLPVFLAALSLSFGVACAAAPQAQSVSLQSSSSSSGSASTSSGSSSTSGSGSTSGSSSGSGTTSGSGSTNPLPTPPSTAKVFTAIEEMTGWESCDSAACAGGSGVGTYWMALNQSTPSMDGNSMEVYNSGAWANALWWNKMGAQNSATNFLWDFYAQVDSTASAQALEFDAFQFLDGYNYMMGSQCNLAAGKWDVWDEANGAWLHTSIPCKTFTPGVWHHIQWYMQRVPNTNNYTFVTLVVDGTAYTLNQTYAAKYVGWSNQVGVQYQLDVNASGTGYHEWIDQSTFTVW